MTNSLQCDEMCDEAIENYEKWLREFYAAVEELENTMFDCAEGSIEIAISSINSTIEELQQATHERDRVSGLCIECGQVSEKERVPLSSVLLAKEAAESAFKDLETISKHKPSNGEQEEKFLEQIHEIAETLVARIWEVL